MIRYKKLNTGKYSHVTQIKFLFWWITTRSFGNSYYAIKHVDNYNNKR